MTARVEIELPLNDDKAPLNKLGVNQYLEEGLSAAKAYFAMGTAIRDDISPMKYERIYSLRVSLPAVYSTLPVTRNIHLSSRALRLYLKFHPRSLRYDPGGK